MKNAKFKITLLFALLAAVVSAFATAKTHFRAGSKKMPRYYYVESVSGTWPNSVYNVHEEQWGDRCDEQVSYVCSFWFDSDLPVTQIATDNSGIEGISFGKWSPAEK